MILTARKRSLGQGNVFTDLCPQGGDRRVCGENVCVVKGGTQDPEADTPPGARGRHYPLDPEAPPTPGRDGH